MRHDFLFRTGVVLLAARAASAIAASYEDALAEGRRLVAEGKVKESITAFDRAIKLRPGSTEALIERGRAWLKQEKSVRALDDFNEVLKREPNHAAALAGRALVHWWKHEYAPAKENAEAAIKADEKNADAHFVLGRVLLVAGYWDRDAALPELTRAIELDPKMAWAYYARSGIFKNNDDWDRALADATRAIEIDPKESHFHEGRANIYEKMKRDDDALADFDRAIALKPKTHLFYGWRGKLHSRNGRHDQAMADLNKALQLHANFADALVCRGFEHTLAGRLDQAERDFEAAVRAAPEWPTARSQRGWFRLRTGKPQPALADLNKAVALGEANPKSGAGCESLGWRAEAHFQLGHFPKVAECVREMMALREPGTEPYAYSAILGALAEQRLNHPVKVRDFLGKANAGLDGKSWVARVLKFLSASGSGDELVSAAKDDGQRTEAHFYAGHALLVQKKADDARVHFEWVRDQGKNSFTEYGLAVAELARLNAPAKE